MTGKFAMSICKDGSSAVYDINLNTNNLVDGNFGADGNTNFNLKYHLHSANDEGNDDLTSTGGHYDPTFKCGGASSYKRNGADVDLCSAAAYPDEGYELGDLSGRNGVLETEQVEGGATNDRTVDVRLIDTDPPRNCDFSETGDKGSGGEWSSVVMHNAGDTGAPRLFGAPFVQCKWTCNPGIFAHKWKHKKCTNPCYDD